MRKKVVVSGDFNRLHCCTNVVTIFFFLFGIFKTFVALSVSGEVCE